MGKQSEKVTRRANGEGSIHFNQAKGMWCAQVVVGYDDAGKRKRKYLYGKTKAEVAIRKNQLEASLAKGTYLEATGITLGRFLNEWVESVCTPSLRATTVTRYNSIIRNHINPSLGVFQLDRLTPLQVQGLYTNKLREGQSPRSVHQLHAILHKALGQAMKWGYVTRNVADAVEPPKSQTNEQQVLSMQQVSKFLEAASTDRLYCLYALAIMTGMRQGELLGLQWSDVDIERGTVIVKRSLQEVNGRLSLSDVKTKKSRRTVFLPQYAVAALQSHYNSVRTSGSNAVGYVFTDTNGGPIRKQNLIRRSFKPLLMRAGLPDIRFHDLRHTHATLLLLQGVNPKLVQERLGHSSIGITLDTYSHVLPNMQEQVARGLDTLFASH